MDGIAPKPTSFHLNLSYKWKFVFFCRHNVDKGVLAIPIKKSGDTLMFQQWHLYSITFSVNFLWCCVMSLMSHLNVIGLKNIFSWKYSSLFRKKNEVSYGYTASLCYNIKAVTSSLLFCSWMWKISNKISDSRLHNFKAAHFVANVGHKHCADRKVIRIDFQVWITSRIHFLQSVYKSEIVHCGGGGWEFL